MLDQVRFSQPLPSWQRCEILLTGLGLLTSSALFARCEWTDPTAISVIVATAIYALLVAVIAGLNKPRLQKFRYVAAFGFVIWFYRSIELIVPALDTPLQDATLLNIDTKLFGVTPSVFAQRFASVGLNELMSGFYLTYLVYLHVCIVHSWLMPLDFTKRFANWIYSIYAVGLAGYMLVPAIGPGIAFAERFNTELSGPIFTPLNRWVVHLGSSVYDAFPSLHVVITLSLLDFDRRNVRNRFYWMLLPASGIGISTVYLRYHYAIDLIAGLLLFVAAKIVFLDDGKKDVRSSNGGA